MKTKSVLLKRSRISRSKFNLIVKYFTDDLTAYETSKLVGVNRHTVERYYTLMRKRIFEQSLKEEKLTGEIEVDESYFGQQKFVVKKDEEQPRRFQWLVCLNAMEKYTQRL